MRVCRSRLSTPSCVAIQDYNMNHAHWFINILLIFSLIFNYYDARNPNFPNCLKKNDKFLCIRVLNGTNMIYMNEDISNKSIIAESYVEIIDGDYNSDLILKTTDSIIGEMPIYDNGICFSNYSSEITLKVYDSTYSIELGYVTLENLDITIDNDPEIFDSPIIKTNNQIEFINENTPTVYIQIWRTSGIEFCCTFIMRHEI